MTFAEQHYVVRAKAIIEEDNAAVSSWSQFASEARLSVAERDRVGADHTRL